MSFISRWSQIIGAYILFFKVDTPPSPVDVMRITADDEYRIDAEGNDRIIATF